MRKSKLRSNASQKRFERLQPNAKVEGRIDRWLQRLSHLAQVGLFIFTLGTIYYTVIPLYQKSLLDEAIAKKEVELKQANRALKLTYEKARPFIARDFALRLSFGCSPYGQQSKERQNVKTDHFERKPPFDYKILSCIQSFIATGKSLDQLSRQDQEAIKALALTAGESVERLRREALENFNSAESRVMKAPESFPPLSELEQLHFNFASNFKSPQQLEKVRLESLIKDEKNRIQLEYYGQAQRIILGVQDIKWPK